MSVFRWSGPGGCRTVSPVWWIRHSSLQMKKVSSCITAFYFRGVISRRWGTCDFADITSCFKVTCSCCSSDSMDVDLRKSGGVVVDDDLDSWNIQTPVKEQERCQEKVISACVQLSVLNSQFTLKSNVFSVFFVLKMSAAEMSGAQSKTFF